MSVKRGDTGGPGQGADLSGGRRGRSEPLILSFDTASHGRSVAVTRGGEPLAVVSGDVRERGSASVLRDVDEALGRAGVALRDVELFAAADGPGSFTGLRAGLATVKAFAATLGRPAVGVHTLHAVAHAAGPSERVMALIPAGRGEFFAQLLSVGEGGEVGELGPAAHDTPEEVLRTALRVGGRVVWAGEGAYTLDEKIREGRLGAAAGLDLTSLEHAAGGREWALAAKPDGLSTHVARLALRSYLRGAHVRADGLTAFYVRASDAELKERCLRQESPGERTPGSTSD